MASRRWVRLAAFVACATALSAQTAPPPQNQQPVFRAGTNLVTVDVYPQIDHRIVEGLKSGDFQVFEDGKPQKVETIEFIRVEPTPPEVTRSDPRNVQEMYKEMADPHTRVFVTFLDHLHTSLTGSHTIRRPLLDMLTRSIGPNDLFGVMRPRMRPQEVTFGRGTLNIEKFLNEQWDWGERLSLPSGPTDPEEVNLTQCFNQRFPPAPGPPVDWIVDDGPLRRFLDHVLIERYREDMALGALEQLVGFLAGKRESRTAVIAITDGWVLFRPDGVLAAEHMRDARSQPSPNGPGRNPFSTERAGMTMGKVWSECVNDLIHLAQLDDEKRLNDLTEMANRANVAFYPLTASGLQTFDGNGPASENPKLGSRATTLDVMNRDHDRLKNRVQGLRTLAENTDGLAIVETNDISGGLKRIENDVSAYYLLGYYSTNTKLDGKLRRLEVKMRPGIDVRARRWYRAGGDAPTPTGAPAASSGRAAAAPTAPAGLDAALASLTLLRPGAEAFVYGAASSKDVAVVVELASRQLSGGQWASGGDVDVELSNAAGQPVASAKGKIEAGARGTIVRVSADPAGGPWIARARISGGGAIDERGPIASPARMLTGVPIVYRATPAPRSPLRPVAEFLFRRTERVHIEWPVLKTLDQRVARLLDRRGQPLALPVTVTERDSDGTAVVAADLILGPLAEGDYVIELVVGSGAETERRFVAIRIVT